MKTYKEIRDNYIPFHRHKINILIHRISVPFLFIGTYGILSKIPVPAGEGYWNFGYLALAALTLYFFNFGFKIVLTMTLFFLVKIFVVTQLNNQFSIMLPVYTFIFVGGWAMQFYGHFIEGRRPAFIQDLHAFPLGLILAYEKKRD